MTKSFTRYGRAALRTGAAPLALGIALIATPGFAQGAPAAQTGADAGAAEEIVVTGSLFRRTDTETPSPVTVLTTESLQQRGITTIADAIQTLSASNGGSVPQSFQGAFASGAQGVSLRGLSVNSTLLLFDGLRPANFPLADDGQRSFADLNTIPSAIVERIETLRDGASSTYGADAVAGVVNVILRKEITGIEGRAEAGVSQRGDAAGQRLQLTAGYGSLDEKGFNFYVSGEYQHSDRLATRDRGFPFNTNNLSSITVPGGFTGANGNVNFLPPNTAGVSSTTAAVVRPANQIDPNNILSGQAIAGTAFQVLQTGGCAAVGQIQHSNAAGQYCEEDQVNKYGEIAPEQTRWGVTGHLTVNLGTDTQAYLIGTYYQSTIFQRRTPSAVRSTNPIYTYGLVLPARLANGALNPNNPFAANGQAAMLFYAFGDIPTTLKNTARTWRFAGGIDGKIGDDWDYTVHGSYMRTELTQDRTGFVNLAGLTSAIVNGTYNFADPASNSQAVRDQISPNQQSKARSELAQIQGILSRSLVDLPGGPLNIGIGGELRYENINDPNANPGDQFLNINAFSAIGHRYVTSGFFEVSAPVITNVELNASGRYDHYSTGFGRFSPKFGAKFTPIRQVAIRGTYAQGFRAPSIPETSGNVVGFTTYTPPASVATQHGNNSYVLPYSVGLNAVGSSDLKPETSRSFTGGVVLEPVSWISLTVDYYNIRKKNVIYQTAATSYANDYLTGNPLPAGITITPNAPDPEHPDLLPTPRFINGVYANGQSLRTSGVDMQLQARLKLSDDVTFTSTLEATRILKYKQVDQDGVVYDYLGTLGPYAVTSASGTPKWRGSWQNTLSAGRLTLTGTAYYTDSYRGWAADYAGVGSCAAGATPESSVKYNGDLSRTLGPALQCKVKHFLNIDFTANLRVNENFSFYMNVMNLFDAKAPFDPNTYGATNFNPAWSTAGVIGRYFKAGATFKF